MLFQSFLVNLIELAAQILGGCLEPLDLSDLVALTGFERLEFLVFTELKYGRVMLVFVNLF